MINEITVFEAVEADIVKFEEVNSELSFDIETYEGETECKKYLAKLRKVYNGIEKLRKSTKKEYLDKGRAVDAEAKTYLERVDAMHDHHSEPLKKLENKRVAEMLEEQEKERQEEKRIQAEKDAELEALRAKVAEQDAKEQAIVDAAEAEKAQAEHDKQIEAEKLVAVEEAKRQAEVDAVLAAEQAERDKAEAIAEVERKAREEAQRIVDEASILAESELRAKIAADKTEAERQDDVEHRREFNRLTVKHLNKYTLDSSMSSMIVSAIVKGEIPNITMNY